VEFEDFPQCKKVIDQCLQNGVLTDWFLFASNCLRISPPLTISPAELEKACRIITMAIDAG
jgi:4-aminobutyrate aminotransferase-like enzyme